MSLLKNFMLFKSMLRIGLNEKEQKSLRDAYDKPPLRSTCQSVSIADRVPYCVVLLPALRGAHSGFAQVG